MNDVKTIIKEQINNFGIIKRISKYEEKATYQSHYLGLIWQFLNPAIQIGIYYFVFGLGVNKGKMMGETPYIIWMLIGIIAWFFINNSLLGGSNSIYRQVGMVSKMKFPVSILPTVNMMSNLVSYWAMMGVLIVSMFIFKIPMTVYWIQYVYYFVCMIAFLLALGILNSTITVLVRDYHIMLQSVLRLLFYLSGAIWNFDTMFKGTSHVWFINLLKLNPVYYIIDGFRNSFLSQGWFWEKGSQTAFFWLFVGIVMIFGSHIHMKFRTRFVDFI